MQIIYVMDPMCGWCYGFQPELEQFLSQHPNVTVDWVMGGLAPDTDEPMSNELKQIIASYWHQIEARSQVTFNHDFWTVNTPYRSTYQACRAVISAEAIAPNSAQAMAKAIQTAYYQHAKNPSLTGTLLACASTIGIDERVFKQVFTSRDTEQQLQQHLSVSRQLGVRGFPALLYIDENKRPYPITLGFCQASELLERFNLIARNTNY
ncbi:DsbA family protein [Thalassotalea euphylliae]|uniref:DsbA family protein n=1 Tax=Thalassotalea euphylliae TaxID=1655234 RepID=UPI0036322DF9